MGGQGPCTGINAVRQPELEQQHHCLLAVAAVVLRALRVNAYWVRVVDIPVNVVVLELWGLDHQKVALANRLLPPAVGHSWQQSGTPVRR